MTEASPRKLNNNLPPHPAAISWSDVYPTGKLRWMDGVLEQQFAQTWRNEMGGATVEEWVAVPSGGSTSE